MDRKIPLKCPSCDSGMQVTELTCPSCETRIQGHFSVSPLLQLGSAQLKFVEVFLRCRGNIREVERELGISYPTVRARLDDVIGHLGFETSQATDADHLDAIQLFESGELTFEETLAKLRKG